MSVFLFVCFFVACFVDWITSILSWRFQTRNRRNQTYVGFVRHGRRALMAGAPSPICVLFFVCVLCLYCFMYFLGLFLFVFCCEWRRTNDIAALSNLRSSQSNFFWRHAPPPHGRRATPGGLLFVVVVIIIFCIFLVALLFFYFLVCFILCFVLLR